MATRVYKIELLVIDHDGIGEAGVKDALENTKYPNHCIAPSVMSVDSHVVEWDDDHPLNKRSSMRAAYEALFEDGN